MYLFIDTTTDKIIFGLINDNNKVVAFKKIQSNKNMVEMTNFYLDEFMKKNNFLLKDLKGLFFTIGPGSFTGMKVGYLIAKTINMVNNNDLEIYTINSLEILNTKTNNPVIQIASSNFYYYDKTIFSLFGLRKKIIFSKNEPKMIKKEINFDKFDEASLQKSLKRFKKESMSEVQLIYINEI